MGVPGPGGPCSEIYYDRGPEYGRDGGPAADEDRYLEVWNLVFMQDQLSEVRAKDDFDIEGPLPSKNVDTGMGLERMAAILQGVDNIYEIDTTWKILDRAAELTEQNYGRDHRTDVALRVVADHVRSAVMLVDDGVLPSNEGRGYVLRRILRRSIRNLRLLAGGQRGGGGAASATGERFLHELTSTAIEAMAEQYPELSRDAANIRTVIDAEEAAFASTLRTGTAIFDAAVEENRRRGSTALSGAQAFQLHDTYGFPIDLTLEMAAEQGLTVDEEGFRRLMAEQRHRAKHDAAEKKTGNADISAFAELLERSGPVTFTGYDQISGEATILGLLVNGVPVPEVAGAGTEVDVVLDRTPFYAEGGGQLADAGTDQGRTAARSRSSTCRPRCPGSSCTAAWSPPARSWWARPRTPRSTSSAAARCPGRTPPPTWCTARCAARWASRRRRRARRTRRAGSGSTSPRRARCRRRCCGTPRTRSTRS